MHLRSIAITAVVALALTLAWPGAAFAASPTATITVADTTLLAGATSVVTITFSEAVTGLTTGDLAVANGRLSDLNSIDGGIHWTAILTPTPDVTDTTNRIRLNLAGVGTVDSNNYAIDTVRPTATVLVADNALAAGQTSLVTITFSEAVNGFSAANLSLTGGSLSNLSSSDGGITWTATLTPTAGINSPTNLITLDLAGVTDNAGNAGSGTSDSNNYAIDHQPPMAGIAMSNTALLAGQTSVVTITFSEAVTGFDNADLTITNGTLGSVTSSDGGITWTATFTPAADTSAATNLVRLTLSGVTDIAGNAGAGSPSSPNYSVNTVRPKATVVVADTSLADGETSLVTITFTEVVTGFGNADLTIANGTLTAVASSDGGRTWTATLRPVVGPAVETYVISLDLTGVTAASGNTGAGTQDSNPYTVAAAQLTLAITVSDTMIGAGETSIVTFRFSRAAIGFGNANVIVAGGTLSPVASVDGGVTFTATFTPTANTTRTGNVISVNLTGVTDSAGASAGNAVVASNPFAIATVVAAAVPAAAPAGAPASTLAATGAEVGGMLTAGVLLMLLGAAAYLARRRVARA